MLTIWEKIVRCDTRKEPQISNAYFWQHHYKFELYPYLNHIDHYSYTYISPVIKNAKLWTRL